MIKRKDILLAFYGDDFTGSTDALEYITRAGAKTMLFIEPPDDDQLAAYPQLDAFGIAGKTRSLPAADMERILITAFERLKACHPRHVHYKVCSTFDSSPAVGSIGKAIDCGAAVFKNAIIPVAGGMPALGRYCVFGNLFARMGTGSNGPLYRIDRHPSMSRHPVTPAEESDLRLHLGKQTDKKIGLIDILQQEKPVDAWQQMIREEEEVILLDVVYEQQLIKTGNWLNSLNKDGSPLFSVGSSAIEMALGSYWNHTQQLQPVQAWKHPGKPVPLLVLSGSCSPVTAAQVAKAKACGFKEVLIDVKSSCNDNGIAMEQVNSIYAFLQQQENVIVHTGEREAVVIAPGKLGSVLGELAKQVAQKKLCKRIVIAGGDTSSYAARAMAIEAVEMIAPLVSGAPLCKAYSKNKAINGLEVNFKGGQVGEEHYFEVLLAGEM